MTYQSYIDTIPKVLCSQHATWVLRGDEMGTEFGTAGVYLSTQLADAPVPVDDRSSLHFVANIVKLKNGILPILLGDDDGMEIQEERASSSSRLQGMQGMLEGALNADILHYVASTHVDLASIGQRSSLIMSGGVQTSDSSASASSSSSSSSLSLSSSLSDEFYDQLQESVEHIEKTPILSREAVLANAACGVQE